MWARKRIDIGWLDLFQGFSGIGLPEKMVRFENQYVTPYIESEWSTEHDSFVCLSVRTGFDLLLDQLQLPAGSEVLMSAVTIQDMARIVEQHGLVPIPIDLDPATMAPITKDIQAAITPQTKAILIAHLFGGIIAFTPYVEIAKQHDLMLIEDCAQAFDGDEYRGHPGSDVVMFSFGPIKTSTALGGAILSVRDSELLTKMRQQNSKYPMQSRWTFYKRVWTYTFLKFIGGYYAFGLLVKLCRLIGKDYETLLNGAVRNFPADQFFQSIRQQPTPALCLLLKRRINKFNTIRQDRRIEAGRLLAKLLTPHFRCPGTGLIRHSFWVFPVEVQDKAGMVSRLREQGFDAATASQLVPVPPPESRSEMLPRRVSECLDRVIYLPFYPELPDSELKRMARVLVDNKSDISEEDQL